MLKARYFDQYELRSVRRRSSLSTIYQAVDTDTKQPVAVRILHSEFSSDPDQVKAFLRRGEILEFLKKQHRDLPIAHLVKYGQAGVKGISRPFIAVEYFDGYDLTELLAAKQRLSVAEATFIIRRVSKALAVVLREKVWHHQMALQAVMVRHVEDQPPEVRLVDFDVVKPERGTSLAVTRLGVSSLTFMSPEQFEGKIVDDRSDVYSLGILFYTLLTGRPPFVDEDSAAMQKMHTGVPVPPLPASFQLAVRDIIMRMLAKQPSDRFRSMEEVLRALDTLAIAPPTATAEEASALSRVASKPAEAVAHEPVASKTAGSGRTTALQGEQTGLGATAKKAGGTIALIFVEFPAALVSFIGTSLAKMWGKLSLTRRIVLILFVLAGAVYLLLSPPKTSLSVHTEPGAAVVSVNGLPIGSTTPIEDYSVDTGNVALHIQKPGYLSIDTSVTMVEGESNELSFRLRPAARLSIAVVPGDALVTIDGDTMASHQVANLELPVGQHTVRASRPGFVDTLHVLTLREGTNGNLRFVLASSMTEKLVITSDPPGASVWIAGQLVGTTPYSNSELRAGNYPVRVASEGYTDFASLVYVSGERPTRIEAKLEKAGSLRITSQPPGAEIIIDGTSVGVTPHTTERFQAGRHKLKLKKDGFHDHDAFFTVTSLQENTVEATLVPYTGRLKIGVKPYGSIYVDDQIVKPDANNYTGDVASGTRTVKVVHPTYGRWEKQVTIATGRELRLSVDFNKFVTISIVSVDESGKPVRGGEIHVDGKGEGKFTPSQMSLRTGVHTIEVRREGFVPVGGQITINLDEEQRQALKFVLKRMK